MKRRFRLSPGGRGARRDIDSEIAFHLEMRAAEFMAEGMSREKALAAARDAFGDLHGVTSQCERIRRNRSRLEAIRALGRDLRLAARSLTRSPGFSAAVVVSLALGIGANTAIFSLANGVLLQPLPYEHGGRVVELRQDAVGLGQSNIGFSPPEIHDYGARARSISAVSEYHSMPFILLGLETPERVQTGVVSAGFFELLGLRPLLGRTFLPGEDSVGAEPVLVLSHHAWRRVFGGDPAVVGRRVEMNDRSHLIVGVLPPIPHYPDENDVYMPISACPFRTPPGGQLTRTNRGYTMFARAREGVSLRRLQEEIGQVATGIQADYPADYPERYGFRTEAVALRDELVREARPTLAILLGTAGFLLLIVCANVANLTLARRVRCEREMAIRASLGAGRLGLFRALLAESILLAAVGGVGGLLLAFLGRDVLVGYLSHLTPRAGEVSIDGSVLAFTAVISLLTAVLLSLLPALPSRLSLMHELREGGGSMTAGGSRLRARSALIVAQVAVSFVLLIGAGLLLRTLINLLRVDPGFRTEQILTARVDLSWSKYRESPPRVDFTDRLLARLERSPGTLHAAVTSSVPLNGQRPIRTPIVVAGVDRLDPVPRVDVRMVTPGYFATMGVPLLKGRVFAAQDREGAPLVLAVNEAMSQAFWPGGRPLEEGVMLGVLGDTTLRVVAVAPNVRHDGLIATDGPTAYVPYAQINTRDLRVLLRTTLDRTSAEAVLRDVVRTLDPEQPVTEVRTLEAIRRTAMASPRVTTFLVGGFAVVALIITATGIGGVIAYSVTQRTREIGIRVALGADRREVLRLVMWQGLVMVGVGLVVGIVGAVVLTQVMGSSLAGAGFLFGVDAMDVGTFLGVGSLLLAVALLACFTPARRATTVDPITALRAE